MPALMAYMSPGGGRRHAFQDCPYLRPGYHTLTIDAAFLDCQACKRRLTAQEREKGAQQDAS